MVHGTQTDTKSSFEEIKKSKQKDCDLATKKLIWSNKSVILWNKWMIFVLPFNPACQDFAQKDYDFTIWNSDLKFKISDLMVGRVIPNLAPLIWFWNSDFSNLMYDFSHPIHDFDNPMGDLASWCVILAIQWVISVTEWVIWQADVWFH